MPGDVIRIDDLEVHCVVGVYPSERDVRQPVRVDLELVVDTEAAALSERLGRTIDYALVATEVAFVLTSGRFLLLETAAHVLAKMLLLPPVGSDGAPPVTEVAVRLRKPGALAHGAMPSVEIRRPAAWLAVGRETKSFGTVDVIHESKTAGIYRLNIAPQRGIPLHVHRVMKESELVLTPGLTCQGRPAPPGTVFRWPHDAPHRYDNPTSKWQSILCIDVPRFIESDEVVVDAPLADVEPEPPLVMMEKPL